MGLSPFQWHLDNRNLVRTDAVVMDDSHYQSEGLTVIQALNVTFVFHYHFNVT